MEGHRYIVRSVKGKKGVNWYMIIGLTGSIASGKSTVSRLLKEQGYAIVDADEIARLVVEPGTPVIQELVQAFGKEVLKEDGSLNREKLGELIFGNVEERDKLNSIMHPAIRGEMIRQREERIAEGANTVVMDIPLLFESKLQSFVDKIIVVSVKRDVQKQRLMTRNQLTEKEAQNRISSQLPMELKEAGADAVIYNNETVKKTEKQLGQIIINWSLKP